MKASGYRSSCDVLRRDGRAITGRGRVRSPRQPVHLPRSSIDGPRRPMDDRPSTRITPRSPEVLRHLSQPEAEVGRACARHAGSGEGSEDAEVWEDVARKIRTGAMPPVGRPRPDKAAAEGVVTWLETELDRVAFEHPNPGRPSLHRLNRAEYQNAIRDLLALEIDAATLLPADIAGTGSTTTPMR